MNKTTTDRDWRKSAYLKRENWPEAVPWTGPRREHGVYPWGESDVEACEYPQHHPDAASISHDDLGDVCPWCGVPIRYYGETIRLHTGTKGELCDLLDLNEHEPAFHPDCYVEWKGRDEQDITE